MNKPELKKIIEEKTTDLFGKDWQDLPLDKREKIVEDFAEVLFDEMDEARETVKELKNQNRDAVLFVFGVLLGVLGGLIAVIIQSLLLQYGIMYYIMVFSLFVIVCLFFIIFVRSEKSKTFHSNKTLSNFHQEVKKELERNKKIAQQ